MIGVLLQSEGVVRRSAVIRFELRRACVMRCFTQLSDAICTALTHFSEPTV